MKKIKATHIIAVLSLFLLFAPAIFADAIAGEDDIGSLYTDHRAYKVGDIVTIIVIESVQGSQSASLDTSKKEGMSGGFGMGLWGSLSGVPSWGASGQETQNGIGKSIRAGSLVAKISTEIIKVLSNGNLVIKGSKVIQINDDKQNLVIEGTIRPEDIGSDNTIASTYVANANIQFEGKGPIGEKVSPGIFTRFLDWLGIF